MHHTKPIAVSALTCLLLAALFAAGKSLGTKAVDIDAFHTRRDAVKITKVTVAGHQVQPGSSTGAREDKPGTPFQADEDWIKTMSISLANRTDKVIVSAQVQIWFPDTGDGTEARPVTVFIMTAGRRPEWAMYHRDGTKMAPDAGKPLLLAPGKTLELQFAEYLDEIRSVVEEKLPFAQITRVNISRSKFYFEDGTCWDGGSASYLAPDSAHPGHYTKLPDTYFPGQPE